MIVYMYIYVYIEEPMLGVCFAVETLQITYNNPNNLNNPDDNTLNSDNNNPSCLTTNELVGTSSEGSENNNNNNNSSNSNQMTSSGECMTLMKELCRTAFRRISLSLSLSLSFLSTYIRDDPDSPDIYIYMLDAYRPSSEANGRAIPS